MGACSFKCYGVGKDLNEAYENACAEVRFNQGHDSYNGTISTTMKTSEDSDAPRFGTKAFSAHLNKAFETIPKWECRAVEVTGKALKEYRERNGLQRKRIKVYFFFGIAGC
jgi:hypothetical protein